MLSPLGMEMFKWYCVELSGHAEERPCQVYSHMLGSWLKAGSSWPPRRIHGDRTSIKAPRGFYVKAEGAPDPAHIVREAAPHCVSIYMSVPRCAKTSASDHPPQAEAAKRQECARDEDSGEGRGQGYS